MRRERKSRFASGRARSLRSRDRAQLEFDDMLIADFFAEDDERDLFEQQQTPVRFGDRRLAEHLSDSTIAAAIIHSGDLDVPVEPLIPIANLSDAPLFALMANAPAQAPAAPSGPTAPSPADPSPARPKPLTPPGVASVERFSAWGVLEGFALGAAAAVALIVTLRAIL